MTNLLQLFQVSYVAFTEGNVGTIFKQHKIPNTNVVWIIHITSIIMYHLYYIHFVQFSYIYIQYIWEQKSVFIFANIHTKNLLALTSSLMGNCFTVVKPNVVTVNLRGGKWPYFPWLRLNICYKIGHCSFSLVFPQWKAIKKSTLASGTLLNTTCSGSVLSER